MFSPHLHLPGALRTVEDSLPLFSAPGMLRLPNFSPALPAILLTPLDHTSECGSALNSPTSDLDLFFSQSISTGRALIQSPSFKNHLHASTPMFIILSWSHCQIPYLFPCCLFHIPWMSNRTLTYCQKANLISPTLFRNFSFVHFSPFSVNDIITHPVGQLWNFGGIPLSPLFLTSYIQFVHRAHEL